MTASHFDAVTRLLGASHSRRPLLTLAGAVLAGVGLTAAPAPASAARGKGKGKGKGKRRCLKNGKRCTGNSGGRGDNCARCCSGLSSARPAGGRRCTCQATGATCQKHKNCCGRNCLNNVCTPACGKGGPCRAFLTSDSYRASLGGVTGADAKCQLLADAAKLGGTYLAWISDSNGNYPASRFVQSTTPYILLDGTQIAANWTALTSGTLEHALDLDERRETGGIVGVWTDTAIDGTPFGTDPTPGATNCSGWTVTSGGGYYGLADETDAFWTGGGLGQYCSDFFRLYCFEQG